MSGWRWMFTAPKDGTVFDVWLGDCDEDERLFYCDGNSRRAPGWHWEAGRFRPATGLAGVPCFVEPTHWMPLPAPPEPASVKESA